MKKVYWIKPIIFIAILILVACKKEKTPADIAYPPVTHWPVVKTLKVTNIDSTSAKLNGTVNGYGLFTTVTFEYGPTTSYGSAVTASESPVTGNKISNVSADISGLTCGTTYHFRIKADNSKWINFYGSDSTFIAGHIPALKTISISGIATTTAVSGGNVISDGCTTITLRGVCWSKTANPTISDSKTSDGVGSGQYLSNIIGLTVGTTYHIRAYASNSTGTAYGDDVSFSTLGQFLPILPTLTTTPVSDITRTTAISGGNITDDVGAAIADRGVDYATTTLGLTGNHLVFPFFSSTHDGTGTGSFTSNLTGLQPGTTYYVRAYADNGCRRAKGNIISFTTLPPLPPLPPCYEVPIVATMAATNISATGATLNGTVNANGLQTTVTFIYLPHNPLAPIWKTLKAMQSPITGNSIINVSADVSGLQTGFGCIFYVRATNSCGTIDGDKMSFTPH